MGTLFDFNFLPDFLLLRNVTMDSTFNQPSSLSPFECQVVEIQDQEEPSKTDGDFHLICVLCCLKLIY